MKLKEIKKWIESLPNNFLEFGVVAAERGKSESTGNLYRYDKPIITLSVDEENEEILFLSSPTTKKQIK
ncbi:MAG: hypothetical protein M0R17_09165 [Candidatus Omnitrophica bacterium]|jgi:hypothetical protein|nr:hypothetical protein [Candidatus Omnitrophota bacterium]